MSGEKARRLIDDWNREHSPGETVIATVDGVERISTTKSPAYLWKGTDAVIHVHGIGGCFPLQMVRAS